MANVKKIKFKDIDRLIVQDGEIKEDIVDIATQKRVVRQIEQEYQLCFSFNEAKRKVNLARLKLYNNQMRSSKAVGDPLMFTVFNTIHASLYDDRLVAKWEGRGGKGDDDVEDNLNALAEFDYDVMMKSQIDYFWNWDAEFFGRGLLLMMEFNRKEGVMAPVPEVIPASTWIRDPRATSVNGDLSGKGAMRFGGYETGASYYELKKLPGYFNLQSLRKEKETSRSLLDETREAHRIATGLENFSQKEETLGKYDNYEFRLLNWFTTIKGERYLVTLGNNRTSLVRLVKLDYNGLWPIQDRVLYPMPGNWDGVTIPDLTEDKQRARAILLNIGMESAKSEVTPSYLYDRTRIKNKNDLNLKINKFVGVDGDVSNAMQPIQKSTAHQYANLIMDILDQSVQRATGATELRQGITSKKNRTLGEQELAAAGGDKRFSMSAKIYGWSEASFWRHWYVMYKKHFKEDIDEKIVRIQGAMSPIWRPLKRDNIISTVDPDVKIESRIVSEEKRLREQQAFTNFASLALMDPENNRRFIQKRLAKLQGLTKEEIDVAFPQTVDEMQAEDENVLLNENEAVQISVTDDHLVHIEIHTKANQNARSLAHILQHKRLMVIKRDRPDLFPPQQPNFQQSQTQQSQPPQTQSQPSQSASTPTQKAPQNLSQFSQQ